MPHANAPAPPPAPDAADTPNAPDTAQDIPPKRDGWMSLACLLVMVALLWGICFLMETARMRVRAYEANPDAPTPSLLPWS